MPKRIGNTLVPRNPVARSSLLRRGGAHQKSRTAERQQQKSQLLGLAENWRDEILDEYAPINSNNDEANNQLALVSVS